MFSFPRDYSFPRLLARDARQGERTRAVKDAPTQGHHQSSLSRYLFIADNASRQMFPSAPIPHESTPNRQQEQTGNAPATLVGRDDSTNGVTHSDSGESQSPTFTPPFTTATTAQLNLPPSSSPPLAAPPPPSRLHLVLSFLSNSTDTDGDTPVDTTQAALAESDNTLQATAVDKDNHTPVPLQHSQTSLSNDRTHPVIARRGRGRPKGWKPGMSYAEVHSRNTPMLDAVQTPGQVPYSAIRGRGRGRGAVRGRVGRPPKLKDPNAVPDQRNGLPKRRGRPPKVPYPDPRHLFRTIRPSFVAFACEWQGCAAELHNLATLRRHLQMVHSPKVATSAKSKHIEAKSFECRWAGCATAASGELPVQFTSDGAWTAHIETVHLVPFAWHLGEGPQNDGDCSKNQDADQVPDYLFGKDGNQVTPWVRYQKEEDLVTYQNNRRKLKELLIRRDAQFASDSDEDEGEAHGTTNDASATA